MPSEDQSRSIVALIQNGCMPKLGSRIWSWNGLKKVRHQPLVQRQNWMQRDHVVLTVARQCQLAVVARCTMYATKKVATHVDEYELILRKRPAAPSPPA